MIDGADALASLGFAGVIAAAIGIIKSIIGDRMPARAPAALALAFAGLLVTIGMISGEFELTLLEAIAVTVAQTAEVLGARELMRNVAGDRVMRYDVTLPGR